MVYSGKKKQGQLKENKYQEYLVQKLQKIYPKAIILKNDPNYKQGIPDLTIFEGPNWATLEVKRDENAPHQPNQDYYVEKMDKMSYSTFIYPQNEEEVLDGMAQTLRARRKTCVPKS